MSKRKPSTKTTTTTFAFGSPSGSGFSPSPSPSPSLSGSSTSLSYIAQPPDLSQIPDPTTVVRFKNLQKKDGNTKARALEELQAVTEAAESVDDATIAAWVNVYPRLSIDSAARVRKHAHGLLGSIGSKSGKRIAKHMPKIVGAWLAGLYDNDKGASKAARDSLLIVFKEEEKLKNIWKAYHATILDYCMNVVANESVYTLSDERSVSPDDAEAKYARVMATCIMSMTRLLSILPVGELDAQNDKYAEYLGSKILWGLSYHTDAFLRTSVYKLLLAALEKRSEGVLMSLKVISPALMLALEQPQIGSAEIFLDTLIAATGKAPDLWQKQKTSQQKTSQKTPLSRLLGFIKCGSQLSTPKYWTKLADLLDNLPIDTLAAEDRTSERLPSAIRDAIESGSEPRTHLSTAWDCYFKAFFRLLGLVEGDSEKADTRLRGSLLPLYTSFLTDENASHSSLQQGAAIYARGLVVLQKLQPSLLENFFAVVWGELENLLFERLVQRDSSTQEKVTADILSANLFAIMGGVFDSCSESDPLFKILQESGSRILAKTLQKFKDSTQGPDAAKILEQFLVKLGYRLTDHGDGLSKMDEFFDSDFKTALESSRAEDVMECFVAFGVICDAARLSTRWKTVVHQVLLSTLAVDIKVKCVTRLIRAASGDLKGKTPLSTELDGYVTNKALDIIHQKTAADYNWEFVKTVLKSQSSCISEAVVLEVLETISNELEVFATLDEQQVHALLGCLSVTLWDYIRASVMSAGGRSLLKTLLLLSHSNGAEFVVDARDILNTIFVSSSTGKQDAVDFSDALAEAIRELVIKPDKYAISVEPLAAEAQRLVRESPGRAGVIEKLLFADKEWSRLLSNLIASAPNLSLAISNPIAGAIFAVEPVRGSERAKRVEFDSNGYSSALRTGLFVSDALRNTGDLPARAEQGVYTTVLHCVALLEELVKDQVIVAGANDLCGADVADVDTGVAEFVGTLQNILRELTSDQALGPIEALVGKLRKHITDRKPQSFYKARALASLLSLPIAKELGATEACLSWLETAEIWKSNNFFEVAALISGVGNLLKQSRKERLCSKLIDSLLGLLPTQADQEGLQFLVLLNLLLPNKDEEPLNIPQPRIMFLVKHLLKWLTEGEEATITAGVLYESLKALTRVLPMLSSMYGDHWGKALEIVGDCWAASVVPQEDTLPMLYASLKLCQVIQDLRGENDDAQDAWSEHEERLQDLLISLLVSFGNANIDQEKVHQPRELCSVQISRLLRGIASEAVKQPEELFPLLKTRSKSLQETTFSILHRLIPEAQEQISIEAAIITSGAQEPRLPVELLSLVMDSPRLVEFEEDRETGYSDLRAFLLYWILIFDHFENASFKVRSIYMDALKEGRYLPIALDTVSSILFTNRIFDATRVDILAYTLGSAESAALDIQWLATHIFYLSLRNTPSLAKSWFLECNNRAMVLAVESFTEKYMSPLLVQRELSAVTEWTQQQRYSEEDMQVKVLKASKEVTASYPVDDQTMEMVVRLPPTFPLRQVEVEGIRRVGLNEQHFQRLLRASQAVVNFQSGSIIDALLLFRKNVSLHFQGISDCAICYSILSVTPDRILPNKACQTCKNKFHSTCLLKWFKTSNSSSCPLCRTSFSFYN